MTQVITPGTHTDEEIWQRIQQLINSGVEQIILANTTAAPVEEGEPVLTADVIGLKKQCPIKSA